MKIITNLLLALLSNYIIYHFLMFMLHVKTITNLLLALLSNHLIYHVVILMLHMFLSIFKNSNIIVTVCTLIYQIWNTCNSFFLSKELKVEFSNAHIFKLLKTMFDPSLTRKLIKTCELTRNYIENEHLHTGCHKSNYKGLIGNLGNPNSANMWNSVFLNSRKSHFHKF